MTAPNSVAYTLAAPAPPARGAAGRVCRVFISYSHLDANADRFSDLPQLFYTELLLLARNWQEFGITEDSIFFDRRKLLPGHRWDDEIETALRECHLFFFLASRQSLASAFCTQRELSHAVAHGKWVVPVILSECQWEDHLIHGIGQECRLGSFNVVPMHAGHPRPIDLWPNQNEALGAVVDQLKPLLQKLADTPQVLAAPGRRQAVISPQLPFTCNQVRPANDFEGGIQAWTSRALLVLVRGEYADHPGGFWQRLLAQNLMAVAARLGGRLLQEAPVTKWPARKKSSESLAPAAIAEAVRCALAEAITGNSQGLPDGQALADALRAKAGVLPLRLDAPGNADWLKLTLPMALDIIESAPADAPLHRLVLAVMVEDRALVQAVDLLATLDLDQGQVRYQRTHVVAPSPLEEITPDEVRGWFEHNELEDRFRLDREDLVEHVFAGQDSVRMRRFSVQVRGLLGL